MSTGDRKLLIPVIMLVVINVTINYTGQGIAPKSNMQNSLIDREGSPHRVTTI